MVFFHIGIKYLLCFGLWSNSSSFWNFIWQWLGSDGIFHLFSYWPCLADIFKRQSLCWGDQGENIIFSTRISTVNLKRQRLKGWVFSDMQFLWWICFSILLKRWLNCLKRFAASVACRGYWIQVLLLNVHPLPCRRKSANTSRSWEDGGKVSTYLRKHTYFCQFMESKLAYFLNIHFLKRATCSILDACEILHIRFVYRDILFPVAAL